MSKSKQTYNEENYGEGKDGGKTKKGKGKDGIKSQLIARVCDILSDDNSTMGCDISRAQITKPNRKGKGVAEIWKKGLNALDDN